MLVRSLCAVVVGAMMVSAQPSVAFEFDNEVDVELVLAVDTSQSVALDEKVIQREGYLAAITSDEVVQAITSGMLGRIAVTYIEWGEAGNERVVVDWQVIDDSTSAQAFADALAARPLGKMQRTSISSLMRFAADGIDRNDYEGLRRVIDISGDGPNDHGGSLLTARQHVLDKGIVINGLPLMLREKRLSLVKDLAAYYRSCVVGGPGAFQVEVRSAQAFARAVKRKLLMEIAGRTPPESRLVPAASSVDVNLCKVGEQLTMAH